MVGVGSFSPIVFGSKIAQFGVVGVEWFAKRRREITASLLGGARATFSLSPVVAAQPGPAAAATWAGVMSSTVNSDFFWMNLLNRRAMDGSTRTTPRATTDGAGWSTPTSGALPVSWSGRMGREAEAGLVLAMVLLFLYGNYVVIFGVLCPVRAPRPPPAHIGLTTYLFSSHSENSEIYLTP